MTPEERAEKIYQALLVPETSLRYVDPTQLIAAEIRAAVEEGVAERLKTNWPECESADRWIRMGKAEAYEDAIQWVRARARDCGCSDWIEENIRARAKEVAG